MDIGFRLFMCKEFDVCFIQASSPAVPTPFDKETSSYVKPGAQFRCNRSDLLVRRRDGPDEVKALLWIVVNILGTQLFNDIVHLTVLPTVNST